MSLASLPIERPATSSPWLGSFAYPGNLHAAPVTWSRCPLAPSSLERRDMHPVLLGRLAALLGQGRRAPGLTLEPAVSAGSISSLQDCHPEYEPTLIIRVQGVSSAGGWRHGTSVSGRCDYCSGTMQSGTSPSGRPVSISAVLHIPLPNFRSNSPVSRPTLPHRSCWSDGREVGMLCSLQPKRRLQSSMQWRSSRPNDAQIRNVSRFPCQCQARA